MSFLLIVVAIENTAYYRPSLQLGGCDGELGDVGGDARLISARTDSRADAGEGFQLSVIQGGKSVIDMGMSAPSGI